MLALSSAAGAAGLGRLSVLSDLGQPLRAEIDVVAVEKGELESLSARLASIETYVQNNLPYPSPSMGLQLTLEMRQSGQPYIVATTAQPINEPFVDILVELTWNDGRILRGYTALIDPPTFGSDEREPSAAQTDAAPEIAPAPMAAPEPSVATQFGSELSQSAPAVDSTQSAVEPTFESAPEVPDEPSAQAPSEPEPALDAAADAVATDDAQAPEPVAEAAPAAVAADSGVDTYQVKRGDTLSGIANQFVSEDVSLDQMLVLLVRSNPDAFVDGNMNRLKAGKVLQIPGGADAAAIDQAEARQVVRLQTADFNAYREKLAAAAAEAAGVSAAGQTASGSITPMVKDEAPAGAEQPKEVVKLSAGDVPANGVQGTRALEEELAAREKTISEQNERVAMLEKQVRDMQALLEIRNKGMADAQQSAQPDAAPAETAPVQAAPEAAAPGAAPAGEPAAAPAATQEPAADKPAKAKKPKVVAKPAPGITDQLLDQPLYLAGGAAVLGLLGFLGFKLARKRKQGDALEPVESTEQPEGESAVEATDAAVAEASTGLASAAPASTGMPPMSEDVDPLAEAEIYMAYGRDGQAEEILKEALQSNPRRHEIHLKLLEIYAKRKDVASFDGVARELHMATGGQGEIWLQAARMGYPLDPQNPRYALGKPDGAEVAASAAAAGAMEDRLDFDIGLDEPDAATKTDIDLTRLGAAAGTSTDVDLSNLSAGQNAMNALAQSGAAGMERTQQTTAMDLDLSADQGKPTGLDFDFDLNGLGNGTADKSPAPTASADAPASMSFDLSKISLDEGALDKVEPRLDVGTASTPDIDLSNIDLSLEGGKSEGSVGGGARDDRWYDVQTKFDLAKAYQEMGDKEGAREILREVIAEGDNEQQAAAQRVLETLA